MAIKLINDINCYKTEIKILKHMIEKIHQDRL